MQLDADVARSEARGVGDLDIAQAEEELERDQLLLLVCEPAKRRMQKRVRLLPFQVIRRKCGKIGWITLMRPFAVVARQFAANDRPEPADDGAILLMKAAD